MAEMTATVGVLTAEVRVLMVGSRQVTMSVYKQLDDIPPADITPFGRVHAKNDGSFSVCVIGASPDGILVRSWLYRSDAYAEAGVLWRENRSTHRYERDRIQRERAAQWEALPLIVLAGLR